MSARRPLSCSFYRRPADEVARDLLGRYLVRRLGGEDLIVRIVETEAYLGESDRASHAWQGRRTPRNASLYSPGGVAYVYFIYGMYFCLNAVAGTADNGEAVLIRAAEPVLGDETMTRNRNLGRSPRSGDLAGGPGKLCQALAIERDLDGHPLQKGPLRLTRGETARSTEFVVRGPRIGIDYAGEAVDWPLRFALAENRHVSRPYPWSW